jgi:phage repressor protein C with HTH and peptisase S24 domain
LSIGEQIEKKQKELNLSDTKMAEILEISSQRLGLYRRGQRNPKNDFFLKWKEVFNEDLLETNVSHETQTYLEQRRNLKNSDNKPDIPGYVGNTKMGNFEAYADDPEMETPVGYFDSRLFPGCNHAEKVNGDSMYPLIVNQGWIIGKIIDKNGMISGEKYCLHLKNGQNITKYVHNLPHKKEYIKIVSHNKSVPDDVIARDQINLCIRVYFIINPS